MSFEIPLPKLHEIISEFSNYNINNCREYLRNIGLITEYSGDYSQDLVTEAHIPKLRSFVDDLMRKVSAITWSKYYKSRAKNKRHLIKSILEDLYAYKRKLKQPLLDYIPQPGTKAKVYKEILEMDDSEFEYLKQLRQQIAEESIPKPSPETVERRPLVLLPPLGPVPEPRREPNILENFPNKYIPPPPEPLPRYIDSEEYKSRHAEDDSEKPVYPKFKDQHVEFIKDRLFDATAVKKNASEEYLENLLQKLNSNPFDTEIDLRKLDNIKEESLEQLLNWFENNIASRLSDKIYVRVYFTRRYTPRTIPLIENLDKVRSLLTEGPLLSIDDDGEEINESDKPIKLFWNTVDRIEFFEAHKVKSNRLRKSHANGFFPRKLNKDYAEFEEVLERYQVYHSYITPEGKLKPGVRTSCLINCLELSGVSRDICLNILGLVGHRKRIERTMLTTIGNEFNLAFHVRIVDNNGEIKNANMNDKGWYGSKTGQKIMLAEYLDHFFIDEPTKICLYSIRNWLDICSETDSYKSLQWRLQVFARQNGNYKSTASRAKASSLEVIRELDRVGAFEAINANSADVQKAQIFTSEVKEEEAVAKEYVKELETKLITPKQKSKKEHQIYYADIETCKKTTEAGDVVCVPFMLCASDVTGSWKRTYTGIGEDSGINCVDKFMLDLPKNALVYFHNLGFDGNFFKRFGHNVMIQKGSKIMTMQANINNKTVILRDSYSLLAKPLRDFPRSFPEAFPEDIVKEVFPYDYYTYERLIAEEPGIISEALTYLKPEDRQQFISNIDSVGARLSEDTFDMMKYCSFYCERDVEVLRLGFNQFAKITLQEPICLNVHEYLSAPTLAYEYMLQNVFYPNEHLYNVGGQLQKYLQKFVYGGRVMTKDNIRYDIRTKLADFDACSLYPSAMRRAFTVEGVPEYYKNPTPEQVFNKNNLPEILQKAFTEDQLKPTSKRCYSQFFVEIQITDIGIPRAFPLIVKREKGIQSNVNECVKMHVDMIMLQDLIEFQDISFTFVDGYVMKGSRDHRIREVIKKLYDLRVEYKKTKNPMQEIIKLIMNSAYGKSIQKVIKTDLKFVNSEDIAFKLYDWYYQIHKAEQISSNKWLVEKYKRKTNQFNNCIFGITILSISKRIMNEVMCLAEDLGIEIYYQDTDSMHIEYDKVEYLNQEFTKKYSRELIGSGMGNFHTDFEPANAYCTRHISLGKKMYLDVLEYEDKNSEIQHKNHIRMKGIPEQVIINHANKYFSGDVTKLYESIFRGATVDFNLLDGKVCMRASRNGTVEYVKKFDRKVRATSSLI